MNLSVKEIEEIMNETGIKGAQAGALLEKIIHRLSLKYDLTIRQHFAFEFCKKFLEQDLKRAMEPSISSHQIVPVDPYMSNASHAVQQADELIKALNEEKEDKESISAMPCSSCKKPRGDKDGLLITPCPHCGDDIPF